MHEEATEGFDVNAVLEECPDGNLRLNPSFEAVLEEQREKVASGMVTREELIRNTGVQSGVVETVSTLADMHSEYLGYFLALTHYIERGGDETHLRWAALLAQFEEPQPPEAGSPEAFVPIHGDWADVFVALYESGIIYIWREDCDPCEVMKAELDQEFDSPPRDLGLFSVYGPEHAQHLADSYDVVGGPTTLFFTGGKMDSRLYGAKSPGVLTKEIEKLRQLSTQ